MRKAYWLAAIAAIGGTLVATACSLFVDSGGLTGASTSDARDDAGEPGVDAASLPNPSIDAGSLGIADGAPDADAAVAADAGVDADASRSFAGALVAEWRFDTPSADAGIDTSGHNHLGTLVGSIAVGAGGHTGGGLMNPDGGGEMTVLGLNGPAFPTSGTLAMWIRCDVDVTDSNVRAVFDDWDSARAHLFIRRLDSTETLQIAAQMNAGSYVAVASRDVVRGEWTHLALTWDATGLVAHVFVNGSDTGSYAYAAPFQPTQQMVQFANGFIGALDDVRIFNRPLTASEVASLL